MEVSSEESVDRRNEQTWLLNQGLHYASAPIDRRRNKAAVSADLRHPLFVLAAPRSFTSVVAAMLGQHPQMYGLPDVELFGAETIAEWWKLCSRNVSPTRSHGTIRAVAQLCFGEQSATTVSLARGWLWRRSHLTTGLLLETLARTVHPRILVDKSPSNVYKVDFMRRAYRMFPRARFLHLVRHPKGHGESVMRYLTERAKDGPVSPEHWLRHLASFPSSPQQPTTPNSDVDPQRGWYALNKNICQFLELVSSEQKRRIRGEDLLRDTDNELRKIAIWMGLSSDAEAIEQMKHPERSPYAQLGPPGARFGNDRFFLENPVLHPERAEPQSLDGPLPWREDGREFLPEVKALAREFRYE